MNHLSPLLLAAIVSTVSPLWSWGSPGATEDAREERLRILRASDQLNALEKTSETSAANITALQSQVAQLQKENASLRSKLDEVNKRLDALQSSFAQQKKALLQEIRKLVASSPAPAPSSDPPAAPTEESGYYHIVEKGQTLSAIAQAFREQGIQVTVDQIRRANNIRNDKLIQVGQKLFIPKS